MTAPEGARLGERGQIYVTLAAATKYAEHRQLRSEEARRELTDVLISGRVQRIDAGGALHVRARARSPVFVDVSATVVPDGRLLVVTAINARSYSGR